VTRILDVLVRDEMVVRANEQSDRRRVSVSLTDKGSAFAEKLRKTSEKYCEKIFYNIPEENRQEVKKALQLLNQAVEKVKDRYKGR
ncbi:MAG: MarR family winged helix-turn-helix transcriptional regulator, partial [Candidatus Omnitrophota bacterium]